MKRFCFFLFLISICIAFESMTGGQETDQPIPEYTLPNPLLNNDGSLVKTQKDWEQKRRPEIVELFAEHVYGHFPQKEVPVKFEVGQSWELESGTGSAKEVAIQIGTGDQQVSATMLLFTPNSDQPVGCFVGLNFNGNHTVHPDATISLTKSWVRDKKKDGVEDNLANAADRGNSASRWPVDTILQRGYALATMYYGDIDPDFDDDFQNGIHPLFFRDGQTKPDKNEWGSIGAWAWSLSRMADYLETDDRVDNTRLIVIGHSRLGKTSLWAGATDERFKIVISNNSGCGGAAISRRRFGEKVDRINTVFPHWFNDRFVEYNDRENELPVDQHMLVASICPRAVYVASATQDQWADPIGEYESLTGAQSVFELYDNGEIPASQPAADQPMQSRFLGYHLRTGKHDLHPYDWEQYLNFANHRTRTMASDDKSSGN